MSYFKNFINYYPYCFSKLTRSNSQNANVLARQNNVKNIIRFNINKFVKVYTSFKANNVFKGNIEEIGDDYLLLKDSNENKHYLIMLTHINFVLFEEEINLFHSKNTNDETKSNNSVRTQLNLSSQGAILLDGNNENILFESNAHQQLPIASLTKIMTAIIAIESGNLDDQVVITEEAASQPPSSCPLTAGDTLQLRDLLYCLLLQSGNDAAWAIAEYIAGSVPAFVDLMNQKASLLNLNQTIFTNPSGLDVPSSNLSTAYEVALLMNYAMMNPVFNTIVGTKTYQTTSNFGTVYTFVHKHRLLNNVDYVTGGKTGFTTPAGRTLVTTAKLEGKKLIVVTLNDPNDWEDHINLFEYGFNLLGIR